MLNNLDLFKIRILAELCRTESVSQTAQSLDVSSSAISQAVSAIESQLGRQLFVRVGKKLKATPLVQELTDKSKLYFDELSTLLSEQSLMREELRIGAPPLFGSRTTTKKSGEFIKLNPNLKVTIYLFGTHRLIDELLDGKLDFAIVDSGPYVNRFPEVAKKTFATEDLVLCCSKTFAKSHGLSNKPSIAVLKTLPHVRYHSGKEGVYKWYDHHFGHFPNVSSPLNIDMPTGVLSAIRDDLGLGVLPRSYVEEMNDGDLFTIEGKKSPLKNELQIAQLKGKVPSRAEKALINFLTA